MKALPLSASCLWLSMAAISHASVILRGTNFSYDPIPSMAADFGPRLPGEGLEGRLTIADPEDGCSAIKDPQIGGDWIALVVRSQKGHSTCSFDKKIRNAEDAGASAVIVYDNMYEALIIMAKPLGNPDPVIPSVFVSQKAGMVMKKLVLAKELYAEIFPASDALWMSMLLSAFAGLIAISVVIATFYFISRRHRIRSLPGQFGYRLMTGADEGMSPAELRALPVVIHEKPPRARRRQEETAGSGSDSDSSGSNLGVKGGGTRKTCTICIEDYREGDKLRVLPCRHRFHMECIDQWLSSRKPLCPICKWDALEEFLECGVARDVEPGPNPGETPRSSLSSQGPQLRLRWLAPWNWWRRRDDDAEGVGASSETQQRGPARAEAIPAGGSPPSPSPSRFLHLSRTPLNYPNMHSVPLSSGQGGVENRPEIQPSQEESGRSQNANT